MITLRARFLRGWQVSCILEAMVEKREKDTRWRLARSPGTIPPRRESWSLNEVIGGRVADLRRSAGLTQEELGDALRQVPALPEAWRHRQTVGQAERGLRSFTAEDLVGLSAFFGVPIGFLLQPAAFTNPTGAGRPATAKTFFKHHVRVGTVVVKASVIDEFVDAQLPDLPNAEGVAAVEEPGRVKPESMDQLAGEPGRRPWAEAIRQGASPGEAYRDAREAHLQTRSRRLPGPTIEVDRNPEGLRLPDGSYGVWTNLPAWPNTWVLVRMEPGGRYTARDELEKRPLRSAVRSGCARVSRPKSPPENPRRKKGGSE